uniref:Protein kinase domain protein n=1 Tax=Mimiviridae sp. ChoanoV1 TaxID=2596887 RepID=A0A5B8HXK1_9VIRU|nr:protein kinase domain protein [Mimiviridae sp. ChoanoV1]
MSFQKSTTFEVKDYIIHKKKIGKGAFSTVYKGYNKNTKVQVAIKEITLETLNKHKKMFKRETDIMMKLKHPNIITLYDTIIDESTENVYLIMDYYSRGDFAKFLNRRPLKEKFAIKYLKQLSLGLKYLLSNNIIHRDLKPQNILISDIGDIKITDFGFARYFDNDLLIQTICGSPLYMAPEIMKNQKYDYKSDLWSVGIIFYEMLIGYTPYKSKNIYELIRKIENDNIDIPNKFHLSIDCKNLLFALLKKNPEERISWEDFFNHKIFLDNDINDRENNLMEISNLNNFPSIPSYENKFLSNSTSHNLYLNSDNKKNEELSDISLNFNFDLEESDEELSDEDIFYDSFETYKDLRMSFQELDFKNSNLKNSILKDYIIIDNIKKHNHNSLKNYLNNSLYFLKESYNYIKNFNSL